MNWKKKLLSILLLMILIGLVVMIILVSINFIKDWWWLSLIFILSLYGINIVLAIYIFYSKNRTDKEKKCWMAINIMLPILGPILFLKYGYYPFYKNKSKKIKKTRIMLDQIYQQTNLKRSSNELYNDIADFISFNSNNKPSDGNIKNINNVEDFYDTSIKLIRSAKKLILINFYIINDSIWFKSIVNELYKKSKDGVKVYLLYDPFGSRKKTLKKVVKKLKENNINVAKFKQQKSFMVTSIDNNRSHKKCLIIDGVKCLTGGFNISDEYLNFNENYHNWIDEAYVLEGNVVNEYSKSFVIDWIVYGNYKNNEKLVHDIRKLKILSNKEHKSNSLIQVYNSNPELRDQQMINFIYLVLSRAKKRVYIHTPYLHLSEDQIRMFSNLVKIGVDVRFILPGHNDNKKFIVAMNSLQYDELIANGIKIYEIDGFIHSKSIIVDDLVLVGSCNMDQRAMCFNYENTAVILSKSFNKKMVNQFNYQVSKSKRINSLEKKDIPIRSKILVKLLMVVEMIF